MARLPTAKLRAAKMCSGIIGFGALRSHHGNATRQATPTSRLTITAGSDRPRRCCSMRAYTAPVSPTAVRTAPTTSIFVPSLGTELGGRKPGRQVQRDGERHDVDSEDPPPAQRIDQDSAEQRADHESRSGPSGPGPDRLGLIGAREPGVDHRQRARHQERGADTLQAARGDQHPATRRDRTQQRRDREDRPVRSSARPAVRTRRRSRLRPG